jgi:hypothetical protein
MEATLIVATGTSASVTGVICHTCCIAPSGPGGAASVSPGSTSLATVPVPRTTTTVEAGDRTVNTVRALPDRVHDTANEPKLGMRMRVSGAERTTVRVAPA